MTLTEATRFVRWWFIHHGPKRDITVNTFNGLLTIDSKQWLIGKYVYVRRSHEEEELHKAVSLLRDEGYLEGAKGTLINVGANIGMTVIALLRNGYFDSAVAFEPDPGNYRLLLRNLEQNGLATKVKPYNVALSSADAMLDLELSKDNSGDHRIRQIDAPGFYGEEDRATVKVEAAALDNLVERDPDLRGKTFDLIWADIQGHESHFFQGARKLLATGVPVISEFWPYGIQRAGVSPQDFCGIVANHFKAFYEIGGVNSAKRPIDEFETLFASYPGPRNFGLVAFVNRRSHFKTRHSTPHSSSA